MTVIHAWISENGHGSICGFVSCSGFVLSRDKFCFVVLGYDLNKTSTRRDIFPLSPTIKQPKQNTENKLYQSIERKRLEYILVMDG